jgi:hypothetical protein
MSDIAEIASNCSLREAIYKELGVSDPESFLPNQSYIDLNQNFQIANRLFPWTNQSTFKEMKLWIATHYFLSEKVSNESLNRKLENYKVSFTLKFQGQQKVVAFNPQQKDNLLTTSYALRDGYFIRGAREHFKIFTPSGSVRNVTLDSCSCKTFQEVLGKRKPCLHLKMAKVYSENHSLFKI